MPHTTDVVAWRGRTVVDQDGFVIGRLEAIYCDEKTGLPAWALVRTGLFKRRKAFVPIGDARPDHDEVRVPFDRSHVRHAPGIEATEELTRDEEALLYWHYGFDYQRDSRMRLRRYAVSVE